MNVEMKAEEIKRSFEETFGDAINDIRLDVFRDGLKKRPAPALWVRMNRERFHEAVKHLSSFGTIHNSVASGSDKGDVLEVLYHLSLFWDEKYSEITVTMGVTVPKDDPHYPTITDIVPGAVPTEREKQEFLGVIVDGIPDPRKLFLQESNIPDGIFPWRKDEHSPESMVVDRHDFDTPPPPPGAKPEESEEAVAEEDGETSQEVE